MRGTQYGESLSKDTSVSCPSNTKLLLNKGDTDELEECDSCRFSAVQLWLACGRAGVVIKPVDEAGTCERAVVEIDSVAEAGTFERVVVVIDSVDEAGAFGRAAVDSGSLFSSM